MNLHTKVYGKPGIQGTLDREENLLRPTLLRNNQKTILKVKKNHLLYKLIKKSFKRLQKTISISIFANRIKDKYARTILLTTSKQARNA